MAEYHFIIEQLVPPANPYGSAKGVDLPFSVEFIPVKIAARKVSLFVLTGNGYFQPFVLALYNLIGYASPCQKTQINPPPEIGAYKSQEKRVYFFLRIQVQKVQAQHILIRLLFSKLLKHIGVVRFEDSFIPRVKTNL